MIGLTVLGCGGSNRSTHGPKQPEHDHHAEMPAGVAAFHDVLSPLWHASEGESRTRDTCDAVETFRQRAGDLVIAPAPGPAASDEPGWRDATAALVHAVEELGGACAEDGRPRFAAAFHELHEQFHRILERAGAGH